MQHLLDLITPADINSKIQLVQLYGWLLSGFVTAILVFLLTYWSDQVKSQRRYKNLATLVLNELGQNRMFCILIKCGIWDDKPVTYHLCVWQKLQIELASYLGEDLFAKLMTLYDSYSHHNQFADVFPSNNPQIFKLTETCFEQLREKIKSDMPFLSEKDVEEKFRNYFNNENPKK